MSYFRRHENRGLLCWVVPGDRRRAPCGQVDLAESPAYRIDVIAIAARS